jgi:hypothetical protein
MQFAVEDDALAVALEAELALVRAGETGQRDLARGHVAAADASGAEPAQVAGYLGKTFAVDELPHLAVLQIVARAQALDFELDVHARRGVGGERAVAVPGRIDEAGQFAGLAICGLRRG